MEKHRAQLLLTWKSKESNINKSSSNQTVSDATAALHLLRRLVCPEFEVFFLPAKDDLIGT